MAINKLNQSLGELESEIMETVWKLESATVRQVLSRLKKKRKIAYTTVMTVMGRLYEKGVLKRKPQENGAYVYIASQSKEDFWADVSKRTISRLIRECGPVAVAQFIDAVENSSVKDLEKWREKLKKIK